MIELGVLQIALALVLMVAAIALVRWQKLGMELTLLNATVRTILQLFAVGYILAVVFAWRNPYSVIAVLLVMLSVATLVARNRIDQNLSRLLPILAGSLLTSLVLTVVYTTGVVIRPETWYEPRYIIPLAGIVLGNALSTPLSEIVSRPIEDQPALVHIDK